MRGKRWALFLSGRGSTAQAVLDNRSGLDVRLVVSSKKNCMGVVRARRQGIPVIILDSKMPWTQLTEELKKRKIQKIFLLGFMKLLPKEFVDVWKDCIVNVHPSLLPKYPGLNSMELSHKDKAMMGVTVHVVTAEMDAGPKLLQKKIRDQENDFASAQLRMSFCEQDLVRRVSELERFAW